MRSPLLLFLMLQLLFLSPAQAQDHANLVIRHMTLESPAGFMNTGGIAMWSPTSEYVALQFQRLEDSQPRQTIWQVFDVKTGALIFTFEEFIAWYADGKRLIFRDEHGTSYLANAQTRYIITPLTDAGKTFDNNLITHHIINLDEGRTLRIYDAETGAIHFTLDGVRDLPAYAPNHTHFAVTVLDQGVQIYNTGDFTLRDHLEGYRIGYAYRKNFWNINSEQLIVMPLNTPLAYLGPYHIWTLGASSLSEPIYNITGGHAWSPDGAYLAVVSDFTKLRIYDSTTGQLLETIREFMDSPISQIEWQQDYIILSRGSYAGALPAPSLEIWRVDQKEVALKIKRDLGHQYWIEADEVMIFEPFQGVYWFSIDTGAMTQNIEFQSLFLSFISPNHRWILELNDAIHVYRLDNGQTTALIVLQDIDAISYASWSPNSQYFATLGTPDGVILWKVIDAY